MRVLNLYSGIGGNRKLWEDVKVTAVELNPQIAAIYQDFFPNDKVIVGDAHQYLLDHYKEFDFIWSSPPCPTHSRVRFWGSHKEDPRVIYPDMSLWQEIIFFKHYAKCLWVVENVIPYYKPLIVGTKLGKYLFWSNFKIPQIKTVNVNANRDLIGKMQETLGINLDGKRLGMRKDKVLRNCVHPETGLHILNSARNSFPQPNEGLFEKVSL